MNDKISLRTLSTPVGELLLGSYGDSLCLCDWHRPHILQRVQRGLGAQIQYCDTPVLRKAAAELSEYFAGARHGFTLPLLTIGTEFQKAVWQTLLTIPYGTHTTYSHLAAQMGRPTAVRAVATANGANAISIFIPCHRVIGADGKLTGYAGGLDAKRMLIDIEHPHNRNIQESIIPL